MSRKLISIFLAIFMLSSLVSGMVSAEAVPSGTVLEASAESGTYEIYPLPQKATYAGTNFTITDEVNVVIEPTVDAATQNFLNQVLASKSLKATKSAAVVSDKTNVLIGTRSSGGYVDTYFGAHIPNDATIFTKNDAYVLDIDKQLETKGSIAILGANTDAVYYGLATLKLIFDQIPGKDLKSVKYEDYSDAKWRGFIEGFYGFPWSHEDRKSLMRFGGQFKMNSYIFAPKNDQYHNSAWRTLYPADELAKVKELVDVGRESKTQFVWAIHPGFSMINWNTYDAELATLLAKLDQLYSIGVRQFGLFLDDISTAQSLTDKDKHVKLVTDVANWAAAKGDVKSLIFCPPYYNQAWTGESGKPYLQALKNVPANVEIMWTGSGVVGTVNTTDMQWPKNATGRDPYVWLNWPVNDYKDARLLLGKGEVLKAGTHNISGVVSNPMGSAELSKIALFAVADFTWNSDDFNDSKSWLDSFKYVAPEAAAELNTIAYHMSDPSPSGHGLQVGESENIKAQLELFLSKFNKGEATTEAGNQLIAEFDRVLNAITSFRAKSGNAKMLTEIDPWLNCLKGVVESAKSATKSAMALQSGDMRLAWEELAKAANAMSESKNYKIKKLNYPDVTVEAGSKRLVPFANELLQKLDARIYSSLDPDFTIPTAMSSYGAVSGLDQMIDGNKSTYVYVQTIQVNGDWYGIDFGKPIQVNDVDILQGRTDTDFDIFQKGILEYSIDGQNWTPIGAERSGFHIAVSELDLKARYVRYRLTHAGIPGGKPDLWTAVREFTVNAKNGKVKLYSNVSELAQTSVNSTDVMAQISNLNNVSLKPSQYVGIQLLSIEKIADIALQSTNAEAVLEVSENGVEWKPVSVGGPYPNAAYFRLINKTDKVLTLNLTNLQVKLQKFSAPVVTHNYESVYQGTIAGIYDGNLDAKVWFGGKQSTGKFVQVDLGGVVNVQNAAVVIGDGEGDYFRKGDLQLSVDGTTWETIHSFNNPGDRSLNFPDHEVPYRYKRVQVANKPARYIRLISTANNEAWLALNEIIVNEGLDKPGTELPAFQVNPQGDTGKEAFYTTDHKLSTFYTPKGDAKPGYLNYKLSKFTEVSQVIILQNPTSISNAEVSVRDGNGWHQAGTLSQSYNAINTANYEHVLEVRIQWNGDVKPQIYEIIPVQREGGFFPATTLTAGSSVVGGQEFNVQIGLNNVTHAVYAEDITLDYDANVMEFVSAKSLPSGISLLLAGKDTLGKIRMLVASQGTSHAITGNLQLLELTFRAKAVSQATEGTISVAKAILADGQGTELGAAASSMKISVTPVVNPGIPGDVNHDGKVSIGDLALVAANYGKDSGSPDWELVKQADVTNDGKIGLEDLVFIASKIVE
ncbi:beta-N-acetylglucosaminidase domain-containing protein [Paenibacillus planticolens]|nr:beta-N-acetylglucosaminidase domain-containing protein [Paenibacillus planticolens]